MSLPYINPGWSAQRLWRRDGQILRCQVMSVGTRGPEWVKLASTLGFSMGEEAKAFLLSPAFKPTRGIVTDVAILACLPISQRLGKEVPHVLLTDFDDEAARLGLSLVSNPEVACLLRALLTSQDLEEMGLDLLTLETPEHLLVAGIQHDFVITRDGPGLHAFKTYQERKAAFSFSRAYQISQSIYEAR